MFIICSWCNRVRIEKEEWQEIDEDMKRLELFEKQLDSGLSHGMCPDCYLEMSKTLDETE